MKHIKTYLSLIVIALACSKVVYGKEVSSKKNTSTLPTNKSENTKVGLDWRIGLLGYYNWEQEYEFFGEYKFYRGLGIRAGVTYVRKSCRAKLIVLDKNKDLSTEVKIKSIDVPITIRFYPIPKWKGCCLFGGFQLGYIVDGELIVTQKAELAQDSSTCNYKMVYLTLTEAKSKVPLQRFQLGIVGGFNYEFALGLVLGFYIYSGLIDIIKADKFVNTNLNFNLSYNFAKLLKYFF
ncbi:MAG: porin family protein [Candidatus Amoebophilus sp.]